MREIACLCGCLDGGVTGDDGSVVGLDGLGGGYERVGLVGLAAGRRGEREGMGVEVVVKEWD